MNSIILTPLENKCHLHSYSFLDFRMTKSTIPIIDQINIKLVYYCILQIHSIFGMITSCLGTAPTSFIYCKARLVTKVLRFMCLHSVYITMVVTNIEIIAVINRKNVYSIIYEKEVFVRDF